MKNDRSRLFRDRDAEDGSRVTSIELFFDLVFVFAVTQLSYRLLTHLSLEGAIETLILFAAIWWLWIFTSWATNWLDPERGLVRLLLMAMMLGTLVLSAWVPNAFDNDGAVGFAFVYIGLQIVRTLAIVWASRVHNPARERNFRRITFYFVLAAPLWIAGAFDDPEWRLLWWAGALAIEYAGPFVFFRTPWLGVSRAEDWDISGEHMAERCGLFIIIALGESLLITGATFAKLPQSLAGFAALAASFVGSAAMWWIYFDTGAKRGGKAFEATEDSGRLARNAYTYLHMPIVAGIVVTAVGDELMLTHPRDPATFVYVLVACGGPTLLLLGNQAFKWITAERPYPPLSHFVGVVLVVATGAGALAFDWTLVVTGSAAAAALAATAFWEWFSLNGGWRRWTSWIGWRTAIALEDSER